MPANQILFLDFRFGMFRVCLGVNELVRTNFDCPQINLTCPHDVAQPHPDEKKERLLKDLHTWATI